METKLISKQRVEEAASPDGLLLARVRDGGAWNALRVLRAEMRRLAQLGHPHATFVTAIAEDGRMVAAQDPDAEVIALGYRMLRPER